MSDINILKKRKPSQALIGAAGVHFVCGELSRLGFIALPTIRNTPGVDVSVISPNGRKTVLQIKTSWSESHWLTPLENNIKEEDDYYFVFVNLKGDTQSGGTQSPEYYVVRSDFIKNYVAKSHKAWLQVPGRRGKVHSTENKIRMFPVPERMFKEKPFRELLGEPIDLQKYQNKWEFLT